MEERGRIPVPPPVASPLPSYWHNPKSPLANYKDKSESRTEPFVYDYIIIGSGISGTLTAHNLLLHSPSSRILMLEAREACSGATGRNGGHTKAASYRTYLQHKEELGKEEALKIVRLEYANILATHTLAKELRIECENEVCNTVDLLYDEETFEAGKEAIEALRADSSLKEREEGGMAWYQTHSVEEARKRFWAADCNSNSAVPEKEELVGAFEYLAGRINAYKFTTGILEKCVKKGLLLCTNTPVSEILPSSGAEGLWDVVTPDSTIRTRQVILATNGYTPHLLKSLQGAIVPLRGQITAQRPGRAAKFPTPLPTTYSFIYKSGYEYMIPRPLPTGGQHIVIGGGLGREPEGGANEFGTIDDSSLNPRISNYLHGSLTGYFGSNNWGEDAKDEKSERVVQEWTGIMGTTADGRPFVGEVPGMKGVWISAGFNGHGMVLCLKSAEALVHMLSEGKGLEWFPESFLITEERLRKSTFNGRTDMKVPETGKGPIAQSRL
jgi:glycine/D-amino acid oxidase-like deaminating enzyme